MTDTLNIPEEEFVPPDTQAELMTEFLAYFDREEVQSERAFALGEFLEALENEGIHRPIAEILVDLMVGVAHLVTEVSNFDDERSVNFVGDAPLQACAVLHATIFEKDRRIRQLEADLAEARGAGDLLS